MSPELNDVMHTVTTGIQQVVFSPFFPVNFKGFVLVHAKDFKSQNVHKLASKLTSTVKYNMMQCGVM